MEILHSIAGLNRRVPEWIGGAEPEPGHTIAETIEESKLLADDRHELERLFGSEIVLGHAAIVGHHAMSATSRFGDSIKK